MYYIYFLGTRNGEFIEAENMKSAKWIFALKNGLHSLAYISGHKVKQSEMSISGNNPAPY